MDFRDLLAGITPPWLAYWGQRFVGGTISLIADIISEGATQAIKATWLGANTYPSDALPHTAIDRGHIRRAPAETDQQFRSRLWRAWELWGEAGTVSFAANALEPFGVDPGSVQLLAAKDWTPDPFSTHWSRFWVILTPPLPWSLTHWGLGPPAWGAGTWGTTATSEEVEAVVKFIWDWKAGHEVPVAVILVLDGAIWGPGPPAWGAGTWGPGGTVYWPLGHYWGTKWAPKTWGANEILGSAQQMRWGTKPNIIGL